MRAEQLLNLNLKQLGLLISWEADANPLRAAACSFGWRYPSDFACYGVTLWVFRQCDENIHIVTQPVVFG